MNQKGLLLWVAGAAGIVFLYAAYKGKTPLEIIQGYSTTGDAVAAPSAAVADGAASTDTTIGATTAESVSGYSADGYSSEDIPQAYAGVAGAYVPPRTAY